MTTVNLFDSNDKAERIEKMFVKYVHFQKNPNLCYLSRLYEEES